MSDKKPVEKQFIFSTKLIEEITEKINDGYIIKRYQNPYLKGEVGIRRSGVTFQMTEEEIEEYIKCKLDIHHFAEKYCKIKREDGSVGKINLRDYQKEILDLFTQNSKSILPASRQVGKCINVLSEIYINVNDESFKIKLYKLIFKYKKNKSIFDYMKYILYLFIDDLSVNKN